MRDTDNFLVFDGFAERQAAPGLREIRRPGDWQAQGAQAALLKIEAVSPPVLRERTERTRIHAPIWRDQHQAAFAARIDRVQAVTWTPT